MRTRRIRQAMRATALLLAPLAACTDFDGLSMPVDGGEAASDSGADAEAGSRKDATREASACAGPHFYIEPQSGHCYHFVPVQISWDAAEKDCIAWGGHLVSITTATEHQFVRQLVAREFPDADPHDGIWIGLNDIASEGAWEWTSGEAFAFNAWAPAAPDVNDHERNCVNQYGTAFNGTWDDFKCTVLQPYLCER